jgi:hypothetical protein
MNSSLQQTDPALDVFYACYLRVMCQDKVGEPDFDAHVIEVTGRIKRHGREVVFPIFSDSLMVERDGICMIVDPRVELPELLAWAKGKDGAHE